MDSDFKDFYDNALSKMGCSFRRYQSDLPKDIGLTMLHTLGFEVPAHGKVSAMYDELIKTMYNGDVSAAKNDELFKYYKVVVYDNVNVHDAKSLQLMGIEDAATNHPSKYAAQYIPQKEAKTYTMAKVGSKFYWYETISKDSFRSNIKAPKSRLFEAKNFAQMQGINEETLELFDLPIVSIDFVPGSNRRHSMIAVDLNVAPKFKGTPVEDLGDEYIADQILRFMRK